MRWVTLCVSCFVLTACASSEGKDGHSITSWVQQNARTVRLMYGQAQNVELVLGQPDERTYCVQLGVAVKATEAALPTPDDKLTSLLQSAAHRYADAATRCLFDTRQWLINGDKDFEAAKRRALELGVDLYGSGT